MIPQRYKFYRAILLLALTIILGAACSSSRLARTNTAPTVRNTVAAYIKAMNQEDIKTLKILYAADFISYAPLYKLPKEQLLESMQKGFEQQNYTIQAEIIEIISGPRIATVQLNWIIIGENEEVIFAQNLLQVWKTEKESWKLARILFFSPSEVPEFDNSGF